MYIELSQNELLKLGSVVFWLPIQRIGNKSQVIWIENDNSLKDISYQEIINDYYDLNLINQCNIYYNNLLNNQNNRTICRKILYPTQEEYQIEYSKDVTYFITQHIQNKVEEYNSKHGVVFDNVDSCTKYKDIEGYSHRQFCIDILNWNATVWDIVRNIEKEVSIGFSDGTITEIPSIDEIISELPIYEV